MSTNAYGTTLLQRQLAGKGKIARRYFNASFCHFAGGKTVTACWWNALENGSHQKLSSLYSGSQLLAIAVTAPLLMLHEDTIH